jgi:hypothetical protein
MADKVVQATGDKNERFGFDGQPLGQVHCRQGKGNFGGIRYII